jgi:hypothetical protein
MTTRTLDSRFRLPAAWFAGVALAAFVLAGCDSDADRACTHVGNCSHGGSDDWITACQDQNDELTDEAQVVGCRHELDAYFECASDNFRCEGNQSSFPPCTPRLDAYSACLAAHASGTACFELESALAKCDGASPPSTEDGDVNGVVEPCTASGDCSAHCYLENLANVCAPEANELAAFANCASHCVF